MTDIHCIGCGGKLQNEDKEKPFYTPKSLDEDKTIYCMRCYRMRHYGEVMPSYVTREDYIEMISGIPQKALVVKVIDLLDVEGSIMGEITKLIRKNRLIVVANKRDLLPKSAKDGRIKSRLNEILNSYDIEPAMIKLISAVKNQGIDDLVETLEKESKKKDIYIIGASNVGKSTIINHMISATMQKNEAPITTFFAPGTTQDFIKIPFFDAHLYDTPGLIKKNHFFDILDTKGLKAIQPKKEIKPRTYQLDPNQTIFAGGLFRLDYITGVPASFTFYLANSLSLHRTRLIKADAFYEKHKGELLQPPYDPEDALSFKVHQFPVNLDKPIDLVVPGLGFVSIKGKGVIRIHLPESITPYQREALIG